MTEKHALDRTTKRSSTCDSRQVSVEWWVGGNLVSAGQKLSWRYGNETASMD